MNLVNESANVPDLRNESLVEAELPKDNQIKFACIHCRTEYEIEVDHPFKLSPFVRYCACDNTKKVNYGRFGSGEIRP